MLRTVTIFLLLVFVCSIIASQKGTYATLPKILILHPVDLKSDTVSKDLGLKFRKIFVQKGGWQVIGVDEIDKKYQEYNMDINNPCKEFTCAFDAGSILQSKYSLYSTITTFENYYIFSFNLIDISITKVVWSKNGEMLIKKKGSPDEALLHRLKQLVDDLDPKKIIKKKPQSKGTLAILDLSTAAEYSKILFERLSTHAYTSGQYDLVGKKELDFILESLAIKPSSIVPSKENLIPLGEKLGVDYLIYSLLEKKADEFNLRLVLLDIKRKKMEREWPYKSSDFRKLLKFENKFFSNLTKIEVPSQQAESKPHSLKWGLLTGSIAAITGVALCYLAWIENKYGNDQYEKWRNADSFQEIKQRPELEDKVKTARLKRNLYGIFGGLFIGGSLVLITF